MSQNTQHLRSAIGSLLMGAATSVISGMLAAPALADPIPIPPNPEVRLPPVFCFRFTDIKPVESDPEGDKFQFEFEVLNWTNQVASGVQLALNEGTGSSGVIDKVPFLAKGKVDQNGRPIGKPDDSGPTGNLNTPNDWKVAQSSKTAVEWEGGTGIANQDLLGANSTQEACALVPGCQAVPDGIQQVCTGWLFWRRCQQIPRNFTPIVNDMETVDNGINVLDGFVVTVDDFDEGELVSLNWFLLDDAGNPLGVSDRGNAYGFGTINLYRQPLDETIDPGSLFGGNTGLGESPTLFYNGVNRITQSVSSSAVASPLAVSTSTALPLASSTRAASFSLAAETVPNIAPEEELVALFKAEFGPGTTANFRNIEDNRFNAPVNITLEPGLTPAPQDIPEPGPMGMVGVFGWLTVRRGWRRVRQARQRKI
ncbi:hypothetical protein [Roseofilum casamattae]|uniref:PEP-CTERM sorting domain-containing protein n=1 Tax=Roseofilum casamattae BLCC-M143 TaxID=3022442 RepID=A0ABT7C2H0_9CYAN|nr:hypothetical protein [Roseofilum casamattae]MDJ1185657.1 hypothetical protein [Roseofilum casamattae BLCC-M143]